MRVKLSHDRLVPARSILRVMKTAAAHGADGAEDIADGYQAASEMLAAVIESLETRLDTSPQEAGDGG